MATERVHEADFNRKGFWALIGTQFQGAFNDNLYKFVIQFYLIDLFTRGAAAPPWKNTPLESWLSETTPEDYVPAIATFLFSLPFILFPAIFGALADKFSKQPVAAATKYIEVAIMAAGGLAFFSRQPVLIFFVLFLMATQSAMFGPAKYGIMPEIMPESRLSWGNGILQMGTIVAIILGTMIAGPLYAWLGDDVYHASIILMLLSVVGCVSAQFITRPPAANPRQRLPLNPLLPWSGMGPYFRAIWRDRVMFNVVLGYIYFWFVGALMQNTAIKFSSATLQLTEDKTSLLLGAIAIGIGIGAVCAGYFSRGKIELGLVPVGAAGMAIFALLLAIPAEFFQGISSDLHFAFVLIVLFGMGFFAGAFDVPLAAAIQHHAPDQMKGGVIATTNMLTFVGMAFSSVVFLALGALGLSTYTVFAMIGLMSAAMGVYICIRLPHLLLRSILWIATTVYCRICVYGRDRIPSLGGALWVCSHVSFADCLALIAATDRDVYFVMGNEVRRAPWMRRVLRGMRTIEFDARGDAREMERVVREIQRTIALGNVVCVTTEGQYAAEGTTVPWHNDYGLLVEGLNAPIIPVYLSRLWQTLYIFEEGRMHWRWPRGLHRIVVQFGTPMPEGASAVDVRKAVQHWGMTAYMTRKHRYDLLHRGFVHSARHNLRRRAISDSLSGELNYFKTLVGSIAFARKLKQRLDGHGMVGVLLPPSVGGTLTNIALQLMGRLPVNLNYTASTETMASCARQCGITQVLTSKRFLERLPLVVPGETVLLEDIRETITGKDRIVAMIIALCMPARLIEVMLGAPRRTENDLATIIFSSGSEGEPKGVMLTHRNIMSNIESALEVFPHDRDSCLVGFLPFFHSFGFMATLWMTISRGLASTFHANPLEYKIIGGLIEKYNGEIMIGTSTLLQGFIRRCSPEQLKPLDFVVCGAEKLAPRVRLAFKEKFGVEPLEGYGTTECAPAVCLNIPDLVSPGFYHRGTRHGTIGRPMPGICVRIVDPDTGQELGVGESGLLLVKGPNIMQGYLNQPEKTAKVLHDGWYETGDIAAVDADGFICITDRLARFSKIAGEMVPHTKVEETLHTLLELTDQMMAVASVPDTQKGERLVVLHTLSEEQLDELLGKMDSSGLPNLWVPRASSFYRIDAIPVLGTGKVDIRSIKKLAQALDLGE